MSETLQTLNSGCHCGAIVFTCRVPKEIEVEACNCSICTMSGYLHVIIAEKNFELLSGEDQLATYTFNSGVAEHYFCKICGVKSFYKPRSNPDGISINLRCLDKRAFDKIDIVDFDGQNWEANAAKLAHKSKA